MVYAPLHREGTLILVILVTGVWRQLFRCYMRLCASVVTWVPPSSRAYRVPWAVADTVFLLIFTFRHSGVAGWPTRSILAHRTVSGRCYPFYVCNTHFCNSIMGTVRAELCLVCRAQILDLYIPWKRSKHTVASRFLSQLETSACDHVQAERSCQLWKLDELHIPRG